MLEPLSGRRGFRAGPLLGRRAEVAFGRSQAVLFRAVLGSAHRVWPIWPSIVGGGEGS
jgi:hypothetical protein